MCVDTMRCEGRCPECVENAERRRRRETATAKVIATKAAKRAAKRN